MMAAFHYMNMNLENVVAREQKRGDHPAPEGANRVILLFSDHAELRVDGELRGTIPLYSPEDYRELRQIAPAVFLPHRTGRSRSAGLVFDFPQPSDTPAMTAVRLNKYVADCTGFSRRTADELIRAGEIRVNGKPGVLGQTILPDTDRVQYQGQPLIRQAKQYLIFYKPKGTVTTRHDPEGRKTIYDILPPRYHHLDPAGRLDRETSGIMLLSNDGDFLHELTHPRFNHDKTYRVKVDKPLLIPALDQLEAGIQLMPEDKLAQAVVKEVPDSKTVILVLKTGMNRQIRRSFESLGYDVVSLKRIAFAGLTLGGLRPGQTRELRPAEMRQFNRHIKPRRPNGRPIQSKR